MRAVGQKILVSNGQKVSFTEAQKLCRDEGTTLVLPRDEDENTALKRIHADLGCDYIHLGVTDREVEGHFTDLGGKTPNYTKWKKNEPNDYKGGEDCVGMSRSSEWNDVPCDTSMHVVCEIYT